MYRSLYKNCLLVYSCVVLRKCRKLRDELRAKALAATQATAWAVGSAETATASTTNSTLPLPDGMVPSDIIEVAELPAEHVLEGMEAIALQIASQVLTKTGFALHIPSRAATNQVYIKEWDRIVLGNKTSTRSFLNVKEARKTAITLRVLSLIHAVLVKRIHITKRDLFYTDVKLFVDQAESDGVLDDVATMIGCTRSKLRKLYILPVLPRYIDDASPCESDRVPTDTLTLTLSLCRLSFSFSLHVVASDKGLVVGRIQFDEDGDPIDCTRMGVGGKAIPPYIDKIENIRSDAEFILLVEKEAAYMRMAEDRFYNRYPCIIITAKGQPDVASRMFLSRITSELQIPVLGLVDSDPYGLKILSVYMSGSKNMSYDSASLTTPDIKWLGLRPSDLNKFDLPEQCRLDMTENDIKTGKELLNEDFIKKNPQWMKELENHGQDQEKGRNPSAVVLWLSIHYRRVPAPKDQGWRLDLTKAMRAARAIPLSLSKSAIAASSTIGTLAAEKQLNRPPVTPQLVLK